MKKLILLLIPIISFLYCSKDAEPDPEPQDPDPVQITIDQLEGYAQKGPYIAGTQIQMRELNENLSQTGSQFSTQIENDQGYFSIENITLESQYVEFSGIGFYFNEVSGAISSANLSLQTLSDVNNRSSLNINILSHLEQKRVERLVTEGNMDFSQAKAQAVNEIFNIFCMSSVNGVESEDLNLLSSGDLNARLLAISVILQGQLSVGELSALLYDIGSDIETDGILNNQDTLNQLKNAASQLVINDGLYLISYNIQQRMEALDITDYTIPEFEDYVISFLECNPDPPIFSDYIEVHDITSNSVEIRSWVTPNSSETTVTLEYGTTEEYGFIANSMQGTINGEQQQEAFFQLDNLSTTEIGQNYFFRFKAENSAGIVYSEYTDCGQCGTNSGPTFFYLDGMITDVDDNQYATVKIGEQYWMKSNLTTTKYRNGVSLSNDFDGDIIATSLADNIVENTISGVEDDGTYDWYQQVGSNWTPTHPYQTHLELTVTDGQVTDIVVIQGGFGYMDGYHDYSNIYIDSHYTFGSGSGQLHLILTEDDLNNQGVWRYPYNDSSYEDPYGKWYNWNAVINTNGICPDGWRIPNVEDITMLGNFLGEQQSDSQWASAGGAMKVSGTEHWGPPNVGATNISGFSLYPNGFLSYGPHDGWPNGSPANVPSEMGEDSTNWVLGPAPDGDAMGSFRAMDSNNKLTLNGGVGNIDTKCIRCIKE